MLKFFIITLLKNIYCLKLAYQENIFSICNNFSIITFIKR